MTNKLRDDNPTPDGKCSHEFIKDNRIESVCKKCSLRVNRSDALDPYKPIMNQPMSYPSLEARCEHDWKEVHDDINGQGVYGEYCERCNDWKDVKDHIGEVNAMVCPHEARVDWEKEAREIVNQFGYRSDSEMSLADIQWLGREIAKALSAAFEKGREAR